VLTEIKDSADKANEKADTADDKAERALSELNYVLKAKLIEGSAKATGGSKRTIRSGRTIA